MIFLVSLAIVTGGGLELWTSKLAKIGADLWNLSDRSRRLSIALDKVISALFVFAGVGLFIDGVTQVL